MSSSIPSWQILTAHAQPFRGARDLAFCLKVPLDSLLVWASSEGSGETARMRRLAWTIAARIGDEYQIRLTRSNYGYSFLWIVLYRNFEWTLNLKWAASWQNRVAKDSSFLHANSEDSDQIGRMPKLIWDLAGRTSVFGFVTRWLKCWCYLFQTKSDHAI